MGGGTGAFAAYRRGMIAGFSPPHPRTLEELLPRELAARLDRLDLLSRKILSGKLPGERRSKRRGQSVEFDDFRDYSPGDDLRHIDWNVYARLDRIFIKLFRAEEDLALNLVVDASASMDVGRPSKLVYAHRLAFALAYVGLVNQNRVAMSVFGRAGPRQLAPVRGRTSVQRLAAFLLESLNPRDGSSALEAESGAAFASAMRQLATVRPARGIMVLLSDFLYDAAPGLNYLAPAAAAGTLDAYAVQLLAPGEIDPTGEAPRGLLGDLRLTDVETAQAAEVTVTPQTIEKYRENLRGHNERLKRECFSRGVAHLIVPTDTPVEQLVTNTLRRGGLLR
ncbi:hypothetical protein PHYC_01048 [Phycisphaerales bacterium]|nr:hypothetical protein PHYC_01048 [Phycisphaerales bacterium]